MNDIKSRLQTIYDAGYRSIQISPMQPKLDKTDLTWPDTASQWWRLYQPLDFKVAEANENYLGTKDDLTSLCNEAKKLGMRIVVDIVSNHLAGKNDQYNSQVYTKYPLRTYNGNTSDSSIEATVWGRVGGLSDVDTGTTQVQNAVLNMLKEYLDCGVNGFRFDTAKHIETPEDGTYASNFWPTILEGATSYASLKNYEKPYYYGEILYQCGGGRSWDIYTKRMSIIDNTQGSHILSDVINKSTLHLLNDYYTGAAIANINSSNEVQLSLNGLVNGSYTDLTSG